MAVATSKYFLTSWRFCEDFFFFISYIIFRCQDEIKNKSRKWTTLMMCFLQLKWKVNLGYAQKRRLIVKWSWALVWLTPLPLLQPYLADHDQDQDFIYQDWDLLPKSYVTHRIWVHNVFVNIEHLIRISILLRILTPSVNFIYRRYTSKLLWLHFGVHGRNI